MNFRNLVELVSRECIRYGSRIHSGNQNIACAAGVAVNWSISCDTDICWRKRIKSNRNVCVFRAVFIFFSSIRSDSEIKNTHSRASQETIDHRRENKTAAVVGAEVRTNNNHIFIFFSVAIHSTSTNEWLCRFDFNRHVIFPFFICISPIKRLEAENWRWNIFILQKILVCRHIRLQQCPLFTFYLVNLLIVHVYPFQCVSTFLRIRVFSLAFKWIWTLLSLAIDRRCWFILNALTILAQRTYYLFRAVVWRTLCISSAASLAT